MSKQNYSHIPKHKTIVMNYIHDAIHDAIHDDTHDAIHDASGLGFCNVDFVKDSPCYNSFFESWTGIFRP